MTPPAASASVAMVDVAGPRHPALLAAIGVAAGIVFGDRMDWHPSVWMLLTALFTILTIILWRRKRLLPAIVSVAVALAGLGAWRVSAEQDGRPVSGLVELTGSGRTVEGFGRLAGVPLLKARGWRAPLDLYAVRGHTGAVPLRCRLLLSTPRSLAGFRFGDYVRFNGYFTAPFVRRNPGGFDYANYLYRQGIDATVTPVGELTHLPQEGSVWSLPNLVEPIRTWVRRALAVHLRPRALALMLGFLLGDTDRLPPDVFDAFRESGTLHLLAVSGANVWLLVGMVTWPLWLLSVPRWPRTIIILVAVLGFSYLTRNEPSVVRAALMVGMILLGRLFGRPVHMLNAVGAAALVILLFAPSHLFQVGFQLSFAAVIGIIIASEKTQPLRRRLGRWGRWLAMPVTSSVAATLATAPVSAWHFGSAPIMGVVANLVLVPLAAVAAHLGIALLVAHAVWSSLAGWLAGPLQMTLAGATAAAGLFAAAPAAVLRWSHPSWFGVANLMLACTLLLSWRHRYRWWRPIVYYILLIIAIFIFRIFTADPAVLGTLALLDTGRQRVAAVATGRDVTWVADDPGLDNDLMQWVVAPFARIQFGTEPPTTWMPWRRMPDSSRTVLAPPSVNDESVARCRWRRYVTPLPGADSVRRIWADRLATLTDTIILIRDMADDVPRLCERLAAETGPGHVMVVPLAAATPPLRRAIDTLRPGCVILFGNGRTRQPDRELALWRLRYPDIEFYATSVHGGIVVTLPADGARVFPTLSDRTVDAIAY